jgi:hypothetical protein
MIELIRKRLYRPRGHSKGASIRLEAIKYYVGRIKI